MGNNGQPNQDEARNALIEELGLSELSKDKQDELLIKMTEVVLRRIFSESLAKLSEGDKEEYMKMIDAEEGPDKIEIFLREKIADYDGMVRSIIDEFKTEMKKA
ncbi:MAG: hypothetical protein HGB08_03965 [Candidatus Moranbacteria bacterium]|nr:hypothetical protein [Candidatus Moranbacteria bacterium]